MERIKTKKEMRKALMYIFLGAFGGYNEGWDEELTVYQCSIPMHGVDVFARYVGAIKDRLFKGYDGYLFEPRCLESFNSIDSTIEHIWNPYNYYHDKNISTKKIPTSN